MPLVDVIKSLGCLAIAGHHFALYRHRGLAGRIQWQAVARHTALSLERVPALGGAMLVRLGYISYSFFCCTSGCCRPLAVSIGAAAPVHRAVDPRRPDRRLALTLFAALLLSGLAVSL